MELVSYTFCLLRRGRARSESGEEELSRLQAGDLAFLDRMRAEGRLLVAGPFDEQEDESLRGFCLYRTGLEETACARRAATRRSRPAAWPPRSMTWLTRPGHVAFPLAGDA